MEVNMNLKKFYTLLLLLVIYQPSFAFRNLNPGQFVQHLSLEDLSGNPLILEKSKGPEITILAFWASWSPDSKNMLMDFQDIHSIYGPSDVRVIAINIDHLKNIDLKERSFLKKFLENNKISYEIALDNDFNLFSEWGVVAVPSALYLNGEGKICNIISGYSPITSSLFIREIINEIRSRELGLNKDGLIIIPEKEFNISFNNSISSVSLQKN